MSIITDKMTRQVQNSSSNDFDLANCYKLLTQTIRLAFDFDFTSSQNQLVQWNDNASVQLLSGDWGDLGFVDGDVVEISFEAEIDGTQWTVTNQSQTIDSIQGDTMYFTSNALPLSAQLGGVLMPQQNVSTVLTINNTSRTNPQEIEFFHNLILNDASHSNGSLLDGEVNRFVVEDTDSMAVNDIKPLDQKGNKSGGRYILNECELSYSGIVSGEAVYYITLRLFLLPYEFADFQRPTWFVGNQCLKSTIEVFGAPEVNNPNSQLTGISFNLQANTGWLNENYNQGDNFFNVDSLSITDGSGDALSEVDHNQLNKISAVITGLNDFDDTIEVSFEVIPPEVDFKNNEFSNLENSYTSYFNLNSPFPGAPNPEKFVFAKNGGQVDNLNQTVDVATANTIKIDFDLDPNGDFANYINGLNEQERRYRIVAVVQSVGGTKNDNDSVALTLKEGILTEAPIPDQPFDGVKEQGFLNHVQDIATGTPSVNYEGRTEDDMVFKAVFDLEDNDPWERINLSVEVVKTLDGTSFDLFNRTFNIDGNPNAPMVNGVIQLDFEEQLNQFLDGDGRNVISIKNTGNTGSGTYEVELIWSMMANWRYWIANNSAFQEFFDNTRPNNGKTQEWVRYLELSGYTLRARVRLIKDNVAYYFGGNINIKDYDDWDGNTIHSFFDSSGNPVTALFSGQEILFRADHILNTGSWDINDMWGYLAFRGKEKDPRKQISTFWDWAGQNLPLKPKTGQTKATLEIVTTNTTDDTARVECLIDGSLAAEIENTPVSRIQSPAEPSCQHPIDYVFDYIEANIVNDSEIITVYNQCLNQVNVSDKNICCPTCDNLYKSIFGDTTVYAIGSRADINAIVSTALDPDASAVCCYDSYKVESFYPSCDAEFNANIVAINSIITGDTSYIDNTLIPTQMNSYTGAVELQKLKNRLEALTTDQNIRYDLYREIIELGLQMICKTDGTKYLTRL